MLIDAAKFPTYHARIATVALLFAGLGSACSHTVSVPKFEASSVRYPASKQAVNLSLTDRRPAEPEFSHGSMAIHVEFDGSKDEIAFFNEALAAELSARGIATNVTSGPDALKVTLRRFDIRNARSSGFAPVVTFATFAADVSDGTKTVRVVGYVKNLRMPVWSMREVDRACYTNSLRALLGEVASKINREFIGATSADSELARLESETKVDDAARRIQATYELGFSNHADAIPVLAKLLADDSEPIRAAALSGLGVLGATAELDVLQDIYVTGKSTSDRYMALKAIGDLGTPEALAYIESARKSAGEKESTDIAELVGLFLDQRPAAPTAPPAADVPVTDDSVTTTTAGETLPTTNGS